MAEWTKNVSVKWRALTPTEKVNYDRMAESDKARYTQQVSCILYCTCYMTNERLDAWVS